MSRLRSLLTHRRMPLVVAALAAAVLWPRLFDGGYREVGLEEGAALAARPGVAILDANVEDVYAAAHLPGARHVSPVTLSEADLPADRAAPLLFYCKNPH